MATNVSTTYSQDVSLFIQKEKLPLVQRQLVLYQFGQALRLEKQNGLTYQGTRYDRTNLPIAPLSEGVPPVGETIPIAIVSATAQQWGDTITVTDIADFTIKHPLFATAKDLIAMNAYETLERNTGNALMANTQINYVNTRGSRGSLVAGDVMNVHEVNRVTAALRIIGSAQFMGLLEEDAKIEAGKPSMASKDPKGTKHYVAVARPEVITDLRENSTVSNAWANSDVNKLYNDEVGYWAGCRWTESNMLPYFVGNAAVNSGGGASDEGSYVANTTGGALANGNYYVQIVGMLTQLGYETMIGAITGPISVGGVGAGSITIVTPNVTGYTYLVYVDNVATPVHLGTSGSGPTVGPLAGQAALINPSTTVTITGIGVARTPPAAPAEDVSVYPTFFFGKDAYGQVMLDDMQFYFLDSAEKVDPLNQLRVVGWKCMWQTIILNNNFMARVESTSAFGATFG